MKNKSASLQNQYKPVRPEPVEGQLASGQGLRQAQSERFEIGQKLISHPQIFSWDIFCRVIDNFGDIGVCWRLAAALAVRGHSVRLWVDDASALGWMAPKGCAGVEVIDWEPQLPISPSISPSDVVIEAFGCEINHEWIASNFIAAPADSMGLKNQNGNENQARNAVFQPVWINLEYLSAESYVERCHGLVSPVLAGAAKGLNKWFFYPGFTEKTGGVIQDGTSKAEPAKGSNTQKISLFCYEPTALPELLLQLSKSETPTELLVTAGRAEKAVKKAVLSLPEHIFQYKNHKKPTQNVREQLLISEQSWMSQTAYDELLKACDLNFVRGEDSLVSALLAGRAFVWNIYPQDDGAHAAKLEAFLDWLQAPPDLRQFHRVWNGLASQPLPTINIPAWTECAHNAKARILQQRDLVSQLIDFAWEKRNLSK